MADEDIEAPGSEEPAEDPATELARLKDDIRMYYGEGIWRAWAHDNFPTRDNVEWNRGYIYGVTDLLARRESVAAAAGERGRSILAHREGAEPRELPEPPAPPDVPTSLLFFTVTTPDSPDDEAAMAAFGQFVADEVVPAINLDATRFGQVSSVQLYSPGVTGHLNSFIIVVGGLIGEEPLADALARLAARGATVQPLGRFAGRKWVAVDGALEEGGPVTD